MELFPWDDSFSVKVNQFDEEHKKLIGYLNQLHTALMSGNSQATLGKVLDDLADYTATHFANEEKIMKQYGYPEYDKQKALHDKFTKQVADLEADFKAGKSGVNFQAVNFMKDWLKSHILGMDKKYSDFLNAKGVR